MILKHYFILIFIFLFSTCFSQDIQYAHEVIKQLCSQQFHGRGYVENGDKIASEYIALQLQRWNIRQISDSYFQTFPISVNSFPDEVFVKIDTSKLEAGEDFLINSNSRSCKGSYHLVWLTAKNLNSLASIDLSKSFLVIDTAIITDKTKEKTDFINQLKKENTFHAKGIIEIIDNKRLTYSISHTVNDFSVLQVKKNKINFDSRILKLKFKNKFLKDYKTQNVIGCISGQSDSIIIFGAHYDHLGQMGKSTYFPGANDNGSGVSLLLNLAEYYSAQKPKPKYTIVFLFFSAEEAGLLGSRFFAEHPLIQLSKVKLMINLDMVGSGDKGITVVNGSVFKKDFNILDSLNKVNHYFVKVNTRGEAKNSDHYYFYSHGVKSFFIYTMGEYSEYHNIYDKAESLDLNGFENLFKLVTSFVDLQ